MVQKCLELADVSYSGKSVAASSVFGRYGCVKKIMRAPRVGEVPISIGLEVPVVVSPQWMEPYLALAEGYISGHAAYSDHYNDLLQKGGYKVIQVVRHPCAVLSSWAKYIAEPGYYWQAVHNHLVLFSFEDRVSFMLNGGSFDDKGALYYRGFRDVLSQVQGWLDDTNVLTVRFEDLVGSQGGGSDDIQRITIENILNHIGHSFQQSDLDAIQKNLFGGTHTFRGGRIDSWKDTLSSETQTLIANTLENHPVVKKMGYDLSCK